VQHARRRTWGAGAAVVDGPGSSATGSGASTRADAVAARDSSDVAGVSWTVWTAAKKSITLTCPSGAATTGTDRAGGQSA